MHVDIVKYGFCESPSQKDIRIKEKYLSHDLFFGYRISYFIVNLNIPPQNLWFMV